MHNILITISFVPILFFSAPSHSLASLASIHRFFRRFSEDQWERLRSPAGGTEGAAGRAPLPQPPSKTTASGTYWALAKPPREESILSLKLQAV